MENGIAIANNTNSPKLVKWHRDISLLFKSGGFTFPIDPNLIETVSLEVAFNLANGKYFSYNKPNIPLHINSGSKHLPQIIKQLPNVTFFYNKTL